MGRQLTNGKPRYHLIFKVCLIVITELSIIEKNNIINRQYFIKEEDYCSSLFNLAVEFLKNHDAKDWFCNGVL